MNTKSRAFDATEDANAILVSALSAESADVDTQLARVNLLSAAGMETVLQLAGEALGRDPVQARRLAGIVAARAEVLGARALVPRARYLQAQTHAIAAEFEHALVLIDEARDGYLVLGAVVEAARTSMGRMLVLQNLGRFQETMETAHSVMAQAAQMPQTDEVVALRARVQHNMGVCLAQLGRYDEALDAYAAADDGYTRLNMPVGELRNDRGVSMLYLGRSQDALRIFEAAHASFGINQPIKRAQTLINIGNAHLLEGNARSGLRIFSQVRELLGPIDAKLHKTTLLLDVAEAYLGLNLHEEALADFQVALADAKASDMATEVARAHWGIGAALIALERWSEAASHLDASEAYYSIGKNAPMLCAVRLRKALQLQAEGRLAPARDMAGLALADVVDGRWPQQQAQAHLLLAQLALPDVAASQAHLNAVEPLVTQVGLPHLQFLLALCRGRAALQARDHTHAEVYLQQACMLADRARSGLNTDHMRVAFVTDKSAAYHALVTCYVQRNGSGDMERAFNASERARARGLADALVSHATQDFAAVQSPETQRLVSLRNELNGIYSSLMHGDVVDGDAGLAKRHQRAVDVEREINMIELRIQSAQGAAGTTSETLELKALQARLNPHTACVSYFAADNTLYAFVVTRQALHLVKLSGDGADSGSDIATVNGLMDQLNMHWDRFRAGSEFAQRNMQQLERSSRAILGKLYLRVFCALERPVRGIENLIILPYGRLHQLPFHALFDGDTFLIDRFTISYAPSATVLDVCLDRSRPSTHNALVVGVADDLIPEALTEARIVANVVGNAQLLVGEAATRDAIISAAPSASYLHFACHGMFRADNPMFSSLKLHDGWLLALDLAKLSLNHATVTLSACESGQSFAQIGDETLGMTRALISAGAAALAVCLWMVSDEAGAMMMRLWYQNLLLNHGRAQALRLAQLNLREKYTHPFYWAPFVVIGNHV